MRATVDLLEMSLGRKGVFHVGRDSVRELRHLKDDASRYVFVLVNIFDERKWPDIPAGERIGSLFGYSVVLSDVPGIRFVEIGTPPATTGLTPLSSM